MLNSALNFARANKQSHLSGLCDWLRIPSISTQPEHVPEVRHAAEYAARYLHDMGISKVEIRETKGHPIVYAEWLEAIDLQTLLIYGHFDVLVGH